jgi:hypothetical protein
MKNNEYGFVYMVKFRYFDNCYKIGSSKDPVSRMSALELQYGPIDIVVCGECNKRMTNERDIQRKLFKYSNAYRRRTNNYTLDTFVGPANSNEHFYFDHIAIFDAMQLFNESCESLFGAHFRVIRINPKFAKVEEA